MSKYYLVNNKPDDFGNCKVELVRTTKANARQYYHHVEVYDDHADVLKEYLPYLTESEEKERSQEERFYGGE